MIDAAGSPEQEQPLGVSPAQSEAEAAALARASADERADANERQGLYEAELVRRRALGRWRRAQAKRARPSFTGGLVGALLALWWWR